MTLTVQADLYQRLAQGDALARKIRRLQRAREIGFVEPFEPGLLQDMRVPVSRHERLQ